MPSVSKKQQRFMAAELARKREGKKTKTSMSEEQLAHFAGSIKGSAPFTKMEINRGYRHLGA